MLEKCGEKSVKNENFLLNVVGMTVTLENVLVLVVGGEIISENFLDMGLGGEYSLENCGNWKSIPRDYCVNEAIGK